MNLDESQSMVEVTIRAEPIDLVKLLKLDPDISGGGEAKMLITEGQVRLNDVVETRKRKKVFDGDIVAYRGRRVRVVVHPAPATDHLEVTP